MTPKIYVGIEYFVKLPTGEWLFPKWTKPGKIDIAETRAGQVGFDQREVAECWCSQVDGEIVEHRYDWMPA